MNEYLFVYGSLMRPFQSSMRRFLEANSQFIGEAQVVGKLYDLGRYPGLILDAPAGRLISGHVFQLGQSEEVLRVLDKYEGIDPQRPAAGEYRRERRTVEMSTGHIDCWIYLYNQATDHLPEITVSNYVAFARRNKEHRRFIASA